MSDTTIPQTTENEVLDAATSPVITEVTSEVPCETAEAPEIEPAEINTARINTAEIDTDSASGFAQLKLLPQVLRAVQKSGYNSPTEIQAAIIPEVLAGRDVLAQSQTGTGKTAAFALPLLSMIETADRKPQVLVLAPTRELAIQVAKAFEVYAAQMPGFTVAAIYGGQDYEIQFRLLKRGVQVVVGTPGRVIDHINRGTLKLSDIRCLVLDEADEMLNMGFLDDVKFVLQNLPEARQIALFSATLPGPIREIAAQYLRDPARITVRSKTMTAESIQQQAILVESRDKLNVLQRLIESEPTDGVIVFTKTRAASVQVAERLQREGLSAVALNGEMAQKLRERTIEKFKSGGLDVLVATDVAARGLDVTRVSHVINFDLPQDSESYIHRIGRTGRAGRHGKAILLLSKSQRGKLRAIEKATRQTVEIIPPPTAKQIEALRIARFKEQILSAMERKDLRRFEKLLTELATESGADLLRIAAAVAALGQGQKLNAPGSSDAANSTNDAYIDRDEENRGKHKGRRNKEHGGESSWQDRDRSKFDQGRGAKHGKGSVKSRRFSPPEPGMERYRIEVGRDDGVLPKNIVGAMINEGGIDGDAIGPIQLHDSYSTVDLPEGMPPALREFLQDVWVSGKKLRIRLHEEGFDSDSGRDSRFKSKPGGFSRFGKSKPKPFAGKKSGGKDKGKFNKFAKRKKSSRNDY
ncbi:MAG: DEAD/DEAH box helicase [Pirellulaceae bacterium]|nr:DEAD/DEAH box helicase [Pirellulaceae bacterium]